MLKVLKSLLTNTLIIASILFMLAIIILGMYEAYTVYTNNVCDDFFNPNC